MTDTGTDQIAAAVEAAVERRVAEPLRALAREIRAEAPGLGRWGYRGHPDQPFGPVTYAQFGEDLILANLFEMQRIERPSFLDVGCHHPVHCNNTALLYERGARGVNVDANPNVTALYEELRPDDLTLTVGVGPEEGSLEYFMIDHLSGRNGFDRASAEEFVAASPEFSIQEVRRIPVVTLDHIVQTRFGGRWPDLLCLDAEGLDMAILRASNFDASTGPLAVCVEAVSGADRDHGGDLAALLAARGYATVARTVGNIIASGIRPRT